MAPYADTRSDWPGEIFHSACYNGRRVRVAQHGKTAGSVAWTVPRWAARVSTATAQHDEISG